MSQQLIQLIGSLTRNEKRYISLNLKTFSSEKEVSGLLSDFNKTEKQIGLKRKKDDLSIIGNSTRLYYKVIDILYQFHEEELPNSGDSSKNLKRAKVLIYKGLYKEGVKLLDKIVTHASKYDYLIKMEALELKLNSAIESVDVDYINTNYLKDKELFSKFHMEYYNLMEYQSMEALIKLESTTLYFYGDDHSITKNFRQLLESETNAYHPLAKIYFNKANAFLAMKKGQPDKAYPFAKRTIDLFEEYQEIKQKNLVIYLKSLRNLCLVLLYLKKHKDAEALLDESERTLVGFKKNSNVDVRTELFTLFVLIRTNILISHDLVKDNISKIKTFENEFQLNIDILKDDEKANSYLNFTILNIYLMNYRQALKYTIQALKISGKVRKDIYHISLMNEIVIHYFLGNTEVMLSKLSAYKRFVSKGDSMFGFEKDLPSLLTVIFNNPQEKALYEKLFLKINESLTNEGKLVTKPFIALFYLKPL
ncbi:MAG: tetratricopeptide repeat protein [Bacteroidia bacterium]|nr:tetratricopeptide repeat protein [Bacteroidia bacterium]